MSQGNATDSNTGKKRIGKEMQIHFIVRVNIH